ncbi:Uncharacterized protein FKW44_009560, partial [Caligus rogercresseyi]
LCQDILNTEKAFFNLNKKINISFERLHNPSSYDGLSILSFKDLWKSLNLYWIQKLWAMDEFWSIHLVKCINLNYRSDPYAGLKKVFHELSQYSSRIQKLCNSLELSIKNFEISLKWEMPTRECFNDLNTYSRSLNFAVETANKELLIYKLAFSRYTHFFGKHVPIIKPEVPFRLKLFNTPSSKFRNLSQTPTLEPFINYLKRRQLNLTVSMSTKMIKNPLLSSSKRWFKYRALTGTLEVRE